MRETVRTVFEALFLITGFTRQELCERLSTSPNKRKAQRVMVKMLQRRGMKRIQITKLISININAITDIKLNGLWEDEFNLLQTVDKLYIKMRYDSIH